MSASHGGYPSGYSSHTPPLLASRTCRRQYAGYNLIRTCRISYPSAYGHEGLCTSFLGDDGPRGEAYDVLLLSAQAALEDRTK